MTYEKTVSVRSNVPADKSVHHSYHSSSDKSSLADNSIELQKNTIINDILQSPGKPLSSDDRSHFEFKLGHDLSKVKIHSNDKATESALILDARAYTIGNNIVFGRDEYSPGTVKGLNLLSHELVHSIQQSSNIRDSPSSLNISTSDDMFEREADAVSRSDTRFTTPRISRAPLMVARQPKSETGEKPKAIDPVVQIRVGIFSKKALLVTGSGVEYEGTVDMSDIEIGNYRAKPNMMLRRWDIDGVKPGLRFELDMGTTVDPWSLPYASVINLQIIPGELEGASLVMTVDERMAKLAELINLFWTGSGSEEEIINLLADTPESQAVELIKRLDEQKINDKSYIQELDRVVDLDNNLRLHEELSALRMKAMGSRGAEELSKAPVLPWHDVMGFFEDNATFDVTELSNGKIRIEYLGGSRLISSTEFGDEVKKLPFNIFVGGQDYDPNQILIIHDYDTGRNVPVVARQLAGYQHSGIRKFLGNVATVASMAVPVSAARTAVGKAAVYTMERVLPAAILLVDENRLNLTKWFPNWGPKMIRYADIVKAGIAIYGIARFAVSGYSIFKQWKEVRMSRMKLDGRSTNPEAERIAVTMENQADGIISEAEKIQASEAAATKAAATEATAAQKSVSQIPAIDEEALSGAARGTPPKTAEPAATPKAPPPQASPNADVFKGITEETKKMLKEKPELKRLLEAHPRAARVLKSCHSLCFPEFITKEQIERLDNILSIAERENIPVNFKNLNRALHEPKNVNDLEKVMVQIEKAFNVTSGVKQDIAEAGRAGGGSSTPAVPDPTEVIRRQPGIATGGRRLRDITGKWLEDGRIGLFPGQIARKMRGMHFKTFDEFRETFWILVSRDKSLSKGWSESNITRMQMGYAPFTPSAEAVGGGSNAVYQLNHRLALKNSGEVYNIDNLEIVSPSFHSKIGD
jgi:hypothetical protein